MTPKKQLPKKTISESSSSYTNLLQGLSERIQLARVQARVWYIRQTIQHGWSCPVLVHQIESALYRRQGNALTNFSRTLPSPQSDLAQQILKDPYNFDFLGLGHEASERDLPSIEQLESQL